MNNYSGNPFEITKAVDLTNEQINELWVDLGDTDHGFYDVIKPTSSMPMFFLGGKGSGRTHILKYFSYELQKMRFTSGVCSGIKKDGYIGIFFRLGTLAESRFSGLGIDSDRWKKCFQYFMDLSIAYKTLTVFEEIFKDCSIDVDYSALSKSISNLFDKRGNEFKGLTLREIIEKIEQFKKDIDYAVNNAPFNRDLLNIEILATEGKLIFDIVNILVQHIEDFEKISVLYLFDELENISFEQQKYIQTLIRMRENPVSFIFSGRLFAVMTKLTQCLTGRGEGEPLENIRNSEFEEVILDNELRKASNYSEFIKKLCLKRVQESFTALQCEDISEVLEYNFHKEDIKDPFASKQLDFLIKEPERARVHLAKLKTKLQKAKCSERITEQIIDNFTYPEYPLVEKTNVFLFYRKWVKSKKEGDLLTASEFIKKNADFFIKSPSANSEHKKVLSHFKADLIAQIYRDHNQPFYYQYTGIDNFIEMSSGIPRSVLSILKETYRISRFKGEKPFLESNARMSKSSQYEGVKAASRVFFETALDGKSGSKEIKNSIDRLATLFAEYRYSDKPTECSVLSFSTKERELTDTTLQNIKRAVEMSLLIKVGDRKDKNSETSEPQYKLAPFLSVLWRFPLTPRGCLSITPALANSIFDPSFKDTYEKSKNERVKKLNVPFEENIDELGLGL